MQTERPQTSPRTSVMLEALDVYEGEDDEPMIEVYGGATFRDVDMRIEEDKDDGQTMLFQRLRLPFEPVPHFRGYIFHKIMQPVEEDDVGFKQLIRRWRSRPWLWDLEILFIGCLGQLRSVYSAESQFTITDILVVIAEQCLWWRYHPRLCYTGHGGGHYRWREASLSCHLPTGRQFVAASLDPARYKDALRASATSLRRTTSTSDQQNGHLHRCQLCWLHQASSRCPRDLFESPSRQGCHSARCRRHQHLCEYSTS